MSAQAGFDWLREVDRGRYRFCQRLAPNVCLAEDRDEARVVVKQHLMAGPDGFPTCDDPRSEIELHSRLAHSHLAEFVCGYPEQRVVVTRWVPGESAARRFFLSPGTEAEALRVLIPVAEAAAYLHQQAVLHRDITPPNVICYGKSATLVDLGAAIKVAPGVWTRLAPMTVAISLLAEPFPWPRPPEVDYGYHSNVYALALLAIYVLTGLPGLSARYWDPQGWAFRENLRHLVLPGLAKVLARALRPSPEDRYPTAGDMLQELLSLP